MYLIVVCLDFKRHKSQKMNEEPTPNKQANKTILLQIGCVVCCGGDARYNAS
jgi:hypothetical protein